jgi:hypothetical protein
VAQTIDNDDASFNTGAVNPEYSASQLAKALLASRQTADAELAERAARRVTQWEGILTNLLSGAADYGSRTPLPDAPAWATLEVATGGFATGRLLASGPLEVYEKELIKRLSIPENDEARLRLNAYFLTDEGMGELMSWLDSSRYSIRYPEEGALLAVAWMCKAGFAEDARQVLSAISPFFPMLRFYPVPDFHAHRCDAGVYVQDVAATRQQLHRVSPHAAILAQRHSVQVWAPLHDRLLALFAETMTSDDWPCQVRPAGWAERAAALLAEFDELNKRSEVPSKYRKAGSHYVQLREYLRQCIASFASLSPKDMGRIRYIYRCSVTKRGHPLSAQSAEVRERQRAEVAAPLYSEIALLVERRLRPFDQDDGLDNPDFCKAAVSEAEATASVPAGTTIPRSLRRKIDRCMRDSIEELTRRGLISSSEMMAGVLPQLTSGLHALGIEDPGLRQLYASIYRAFRRRRSLLLLNLESQVRLGELPWVSAIDRFRRKDLSEATAARQTLEQVVLLALEHFPQAILPNRLVREMAELAKRAGLTIPLVEELATDIFMGAFGAKFTHASKVASSMLKGSLYSDYYQIDATRIGSLPDGNASAQSLWPWAKREVPQDFAQLCAQRAGVALGQRRPALNGMIIEQQQIMTTQNLAALISGLDLRAALQGRFGGMAQSCFQWICSRNQVKVDDWHAQLILIKNSAYAWRQMVFYLSMLPPAEMRSALDLMETYFEKQSEDFQLRFRPVFDWLKACAQTTHLTTAVNERGRQFLGWSDTRHWLMRP